jgi:hypothetical protein
MSAVSFCISRLTSAVVLSMLCQAAILPGQQVAQRPSLPRPTGEFGVGRASFDMTDSTRNEPFASTPGAKRKIVVHVWYPVDKAAVEGVKPAPYLPGFEQVRSQLTDSDVHGLFKPATYSGPMSLPVTDVYEGIAMPRGGMKFPLVLFSHGWGNPTFLYTTELEDIVSHGYIVLAVDHTYDTAYTEFSDGTFALFAQKAFDEAVKLPHGFNDYAKARVAIMAQDNQFALTQVLQLASSTAKVPFHDRIDDQHIAAIGHSIGGLASARTCQIDPRIEACMDQDSVDYRGSAFAVTDLETVEQQPFFLFVVSSADIWSSNVVNPSDHDLAVQKMSRLDYGNLVRSEQANQDRQLVAIKGGAYRLMLFNVPDFIHRSFTDQTLLVTDDHHDAAVHNYRVAETYTLAFLDKYLKGVSAPVLDADKQVDEHAVLQTFAH